MTDYAIVGSSPIGIRNSLIDAIESGVLSIKGTVTEINLPIPCRVRLFEKLSGRMVSDVVTDNSGNYEFTNLVPVQFFLVAHHPTSQLNAVIQDNVVPK